MEVKRASLLGKLGRIALGLALGAGLAEVGFHLRDDGAFPHLNVYEPDPVLALRLRPGATQKLFVASGNPVTSVRINAAGFRGEELRQPANDEIIVVGDSQVFGLGVEEGETASAQLAAITGRRVINAGVPTYGPLEYNAIAERLLATYEGATVVYVVNFVNDLFEASHPNVTRHVEWDGWAVRKETAPDHVASFPGRAWLFRDSHAVLAFRSFLYEHGDKLDDRGFASEGSVPDLVRSSKRDHERAAKENEAKAAEREEQLSTLTAKQLAAETAVEQAALDALQIRGQEVGEAYLRSRNNPGDIVIKYDVYAEEAREPVRTATHIFNGAKVRKQVEAQIREYVERKSARELKEGIKLAHSVEERDLLEKRLAELRAAPLEIVRAWSPMRPHLEAIKKICDARRARLLVVALPMDVQVSKEEWAKYGSTTPPADMEESKILIDDLVASSEALGALALDATPALAAAEPGAFLKGDIHMTPKGQRAFAEAIAQKLKE